MNIKRRFMLGEEWVYYKIHSGPKMLEEILTNEIYEVVKALDKQNTIDNFFFIRYVDDDGPHLRIRFHVHEAAGIGEVIRCFCDRIKHYVDNRIVYKVTTDVYIRELERYGAENIGDTEMLFGFSSWDVINDIRHSLQVGDPDYRWQSGILRIDRILDALDFSVRDKLNLFENCYKMFAKEFGVNASSADQLKRKQRDKKLDIERLLEPAQTRGYIETSMSYLHPEKMMDAIKRVQLAYPEQKDMFNYLSSLMHMHYNRLFTSEQRLHELVIYHMLTSYYKSYIARYLAK